MSRHTWMRRLLPHRHDSIASPILATMLGYGRTTTAVVSNETVLARLRNAEDPHDRLCHAFDYLRRVLRRAERKARYRNDQDTLKLLEKVRSEQTNRLLVVTENLKDVLGARGYERL